MLAELRRIITDGTLLGLLKDPNTPWQTLEVLYEEPRVERVWVQVGENRLNVQRIYPCSGDPFFHAHPWPCAIFVVKNRYKMNIGYGSPFGPTPRIAATVEMVAGSHYEMLDPNGWHDVSPIGDPVLSLMLTGPVWTKRPPISPQQKAENQPLSDEVKRLILEEILEKIDPTPHEQQEPSPLPGDPPGS